MKMLLKKIWIVAGIILVLFILLNPGINRFKEYSGLVGKDSRYIKRKYNFVIFSIYEDSYSDKKYLGILMNFININKGSKVIDNYTTTDSPAKNVPPSFYDVTVGTVYKTNDGRTYSKKQLLNYGYSEDRVRAGIYNGTLIPLNQSLVLNDSKMKLWSVLSELDLYAKSYEEFRNKYSSADSIDFLYNGLMDDKLYSKSKKEFFNEFFPDLKPHFDPNKPYTIVKDSTQ